MACYNVLGFAKPQSPHFTIASEHSLLWITLGNSPFLTTAISISSSALLIIRALLHAGSLTPYFSVIRHAGCAAYMTESKTCIYIILFYIILPIISIISLYYIFNNIIFLLFLSLSNGFPFPVHFSFSICMKFSHISETTASNDSERALCQLKNDCICFCSSSSPGCCSAMPRAQ